MKNSVLYVVEMIDYSERRGEQLSRVRRLEDRDGDGRFEHATVFLDNLPWATSVTCWDGGVFVTASPDIIYARDTNGGRRGGRAPRGLHRLWRRPGKAERAGALQQPHMGTGSADPWSHRRQWRAHPPRGGRPAPRRGGECGWRGLFL